MSLIARLCPDQFDPSNNSLHELPLRLVSERLAGRILESQIE
jgi:hypothetical protein